MANFDAILENDRAWFLGLSEYSHGFSQDQINKEVSDPLQDLSRRYINEIDSNLWSDSFVEKCLFRMWLSWKFHWGRSQELEKNRSGHRVLESLVEGRHPVSGQRLDGNPLYDCVVAEGAIMQNKNCSTLLRTINKEVFTEQSKKWAQVDEFDLEHDFWIDLVGVQEGQATKIDRFVGKTSIKVWLRRVIHNYLIDYYRRQTKRIHHEFVSASRNKDGHDASLESVVDLSAVIAEHTQTAFQSLSQREQVVLWFRAVQGLSNREIARRLQVSEGNASRCARSAIEKFGQSFRKKSGIQTQSRDIDDVLERGSLMLARNLLDELSNLEPDLILTYEPTMTKPKNKKHDNDRVNEPSPRPVDDLEVDKESDANEEAKKFAGRGDPAMLEPPTVIGRDQFTEDFYVAPPESDVLKSKQEQPKADNIVRKQPPISDADLSLWQKVLPSAKDVVDVAMDKGPDELFASLIPVPEIERPNWLCLDARNCDEAQKIHDWIDDFLDLRYAQPSQGTALSYEPNLIVVCSSNVNKEAFPQSMDVRVMLTEDAELRASEIYRKSVQQSALGFIAASGAGAVDLPEGYFEREMDEGLNPEERRALEKLDKNLQKAKRRFSK